MRTGSPTAFALTLTALAATLAIASPARPASAQEEPDAIERARAHMERGQSLYLQARFEESAAEFEAAFDAQPFGAFLYNAAISLERAGQAARAAALYERYLSTDPDASDAASVRERIVALRAAISAAEATPEPPPPAVDPEGPEPTDPVGVSEASTDPEGPGTPGATDPIEPGGETTEAGEPETPELPETVEAAAFKSLLSVRTNPENATVTVLDGGTTLASATSPFAHTLDPGRFTVRVSHPDYQTVEREVDVESGRVYVLIVEMSQGEFLGYLRVASNVPGAAVFIDDREAGPRGQTPFEAPIPIGTHHIWVERAGYAPVERDADVGVGDQMTIDVELERVTFGRLRVSANIRGASVSIDGEPLGAVPYEGQVPSGHHRLRVEADGMKAYETAIDISRGQLTPVEVQLRNEAGRGSAWATTVFAALFLGGGITLAVLGNERMNDLDQARMEGTLASDDPRLDEGLFMYIGADAAFGASFLLSCLALYYFLNDPLPDSDGTVAESEDWALLPMLDPVSQTAGLSLAGAF